MGVAWIEGFQSLGMIAVPKHFAGHGEPVGGRDSQDYGLSERTMREIHLPPFRAAVEEAHVGGIMAAYGLWDGVPDNASITLLQKILRQEWSFDGMVVLCRSRRKPSPWQRQPESTWNAARSTRP